MIYEVIVGEAGSGKTTRLFSKAAEQVAISPVIVLVDEMDEHKAYERISDFIQPDTETFEMVVSHVQSATLYNGVLGLKNQLEKSLEQVPDATHVYIDITGVIPMEIMDIVGNRELIVTKQTIRNIRTI